MVAGLLVKSLTRISPEAECLREDLGELGFHLYHRSIKTLIFNFNSSVLFAQLGNIFQCLPLSITKIMILNFNSSVLLAQLGNIFQYSPRSAGQILKNQVLPCWASPGKYCPVEQAILKS